MISGASYKKQVFIERFGQESRSVRCSDTISVRFDEPLSLGKCSS